MLEKQVVDVAQSLIGYIKISILLKLEVTTLHRGLCKEPDS